MIHRTRSGRFAIHDQVNVKVFRDGGVDSFQEAQEFLMALPVVERGRHFAGGYIQSGEKRGGPVAHVIVTFRTLPLCCGAIIISTRE